MREIEIISKQSNLPKDKIKVAAYARVSSGKDAMLHSLDAQISYYNALIDSHPEWKFAGIYADGGISGTKVDRPEFQRLLQDCRSGKMHLILTKSITRFARNTVVLLQTIRELKELNVNVFFEKEQLYSISSDGELLITLLASFAQEEAKSASDNQRWRIQKKFEQGLPWNGNFFGYRISQTGSLEIISEEAEIVKRIFSMYLSGMGMVSIANKLHEEQIPTKFGGEWRASQIRKILKNEAYIGKLLLQKTFRENFMDKKATINTGQRPKFAVEEAHAPIIPIEVFEAAQAEISRRNAHSNRDTIARYPFSGMIHCGICGAVYRRKMVTQDKNKPNKPTWICQTYNTRGKKFCASKRIPEHILIEKTCEILNLSDLTNVNLKDYLTDITIPNGNEIVFHLLSGEVKTVTWSVSRKDSWTSEMKEEARRRKLQQKGEKPCQS